MDGTSFGKHLAESLIFAGILCAVGGAIIGIGLWVLVPWLLHHISFTVH